MVRLVFRPYTQVRRTICTSVSLRASIRVSPDFTLLKHSSPSFGSYQIYSYSILHRRSRWVDVAGCPSHLIITFISPMSLSLESSHIWYTPWSVFQDGSYKAFFTRSLESPSVAVSTSHEFKQNTDESTNAQLILYIAYEYIKHKWIINRSDAYSLYASFSTISSLLTLFSKFFSSFLHSTCMLSVSHQYLVLGEV